MVSAPAAECSPGFATDTFQCQPYPRFQSKGNVLRADSSASRWIGETKQGANRDTAATQATRQSGPGQNSGTAGSWNRMSVVTCNIMADRARQGKAQGY